MTNAPSPPMDLHVLCKCRKDFFVYSLYHSGLLHSIEVVDENFPWGILIKSQTPSFHCHLVLKYFLDGIEGQHSMAHNKGYHYSYRHHKHISL